VILVVAPGPRTTVQDAGRFGYAHLGVPRAGAIDLPSLRAANLAVGNAADTAGLEVVIGPLTVQATRDLDVAVAGADVRAVLDGEPLPADQRVTVREGQRLRVASGPNGVYTYLAVHGGLDVPMVLGSRSTDTLSGIGPPPLAAGDRLAIASVTAAGSGSPVGMPSPVGSGSLRLLLGPHAHYFSDDAVDRLCGQDWTVTPRSDRTALRLAGSGVEPLRHDLPSEALVPGAVQVPPDGQPILFLAHPTTGGYPLIGVVAAADLPRAAALRPGRTLRFESSLRPAGR
jgi:biotin-dependent carboxylase-like uncharacterized protein